MCDCKEEEKETIDESQVKEVQFEFKKKHNERSMKALQNSYQHKKQQINAERWKELTIFEQSVRDGSLDGEYSVILLE